MSQVIGQKKQRKKLKSSVKSTGLYQNPVNTKVIVTKQIETSLNTLLNAIGVPAEDTWKLSEEPSYFYYCANETIHGIELENIPAVVPKDVPIVCDMSSNFLTRPFDVTKVNEILLSFYFQSICSFL